MQIVHGGNLEFNALLYDQHHPATVQYLRNQVDNVVAYSQTLTSAAKDFFSNTRNVLEEAVGNEAIRRARAALQRAGHVFQRDEIRVLSTVEDMQNAPLTMQRWIMAQPYVRGMWQAQRCDGYSETYIDVDPGNIGPNHYDYRRVMTDIVDDEPDGEGSDFVIYHYGDEIKEGDRELTFSEKIEIITVWDLIEARMRDGVRDPTSVTDNDL